MGGVPGMASSFSLVSRSGIDDSRPRYTMTGVIENIVCRSVFHDFSGIHNGDPVRHVGDNAEIVRYEYDERLRSALIRLISSSICDCMVTSSAVVGSSHISMSGFAASAMAITIRWRIPPENSNGYCLYLTDGSGIPTSSRSLSALVFASLLVILNTKAETQSLR